MACKVCHDLGGAFDGGWWYACRACDEPKPQLGDWNVGIPRSAAATEAWRAKAIANNQTVAVDMVNHPPHYTKHPSGIECIQVVEHMGFNLGNAIKYIWRADLKKDAVEDMKKAIFYINREIEKREVKPRDG